MAQVWAGRCQAALVPTRAILSLGRTLGTNQRLASEIQISIFGETEVPPSSPRKDLSPYVMRAIISSNRTMRRTQVHYSYPADAINESCGVVGLEISWIYANVVYCWAGCGTQYATDDINLSGRQLPRQVERYIGHREFRQFPDFYRRPFLRDRRKSTPAGPRVYPSFPNHQIPRTCAAPRPHLLSLVAVRIELVALRDSSQCRW